MVSMGMVYAADGGSGVHGQVLQCLHPSSLIRHGMGYEYYEVEYEVILREGVHDFLAVICFHGYEV